MPIAKHRTKKTPHSIWVKRRNKRKYQRKYHAKHISSNKQVDMAALSEPKRNPFETSDRQAKGIYSKKFGRNKKCFCGSEIKFKKCCLNDKGM